MEIMPITKFNIIQKEKLNYDVKQGVILGLNNYFILTLEGDIKKYGYVLIDHINKFNWFKTKSEAIFFMNDILKDI
jgi:hypothetical protein